MKKILFAFAILALFTACNESNPDPKPAPDLIETSVTGDENKTVANLHIMGVHCDGCRGKIKKELAALECVKVAEFSESDNPELARAVVEYDESKCNHEVLVDKVNTIVDGQYTVRKAEVVHMTVE